MPYNHDEKSVLISIIVPVYNKERSLQNCIDSLDAQTIDKSLMEVILVNDGSTDESLSICERAAQRHSYIRVLSQKNQGVSAARNAALSQALGRYLMFLDADDFVSKATLKSVSTFFTRFEDEVDVVTYPLRYLNPQTRNKKAHMREGWLATEGVYSLAENPFIAQTTMNICVKNKGPENILFDVSLKMGEDQLYITENLKEKAKIGFCLNAEYVYVKDGGNSSRIGNNPLYAYDDMIRLYTMLLRMQEHSGMKRYAYQTILYNIGWRLRSNLLFPTFSFGEERKRQEERLSEIMRSIPAQEYCECPYLSEYHKSFLLDRYGFVLKPVAVEYAHAAKIAIADGYTWETKPPTMYVSYFMKAGGQFELRGRLACPSFLWERQPRLFACSAYGEKEIPLGPSSYDYSEAKVKTAKCYSFTFLPPSSWGQPGCRIRFRVEIPSRKVPDIKIELALRRHNARATKDLLAFCDCSVTVEGDSLAIRRKDVVGNALSLVEGCMDDRVFFAKRAALRLFLLRNRSKRIWLYVDLPTSSSEGNALVQILHDLDKDDGVDRYYVSNFGEQLIEKYPLLSGRVLKCESRQHVYCSFKAEVIMASYLENFTFRPVSQSTFNELGDLLQPQRCVYLQHGILHAHMPWYVSYDRILFDYVVVSTQFEMNNLIENYCFPASSLIASGMPRFDLLQRGSAQRRKKIAFIPSWRAYLVTGRASERVGIEEAFRSSSFYKGIKAFFERLSSGGLLDRYEFDLDIKLHPNFECYRGLFEFDDPRLHLITGEINEREYSVVISDFSSYIYDFIYAGSDVLYFVPDFVEFKAGLNQYSELDIPFGEGFGPFCTSPGDAELALERMLAYHDAKDVYRADVKDFFLHEDRGNADRLYGAVSLLCAGRDASDCQTMKSKNL